MTTAKWIVAAALLAFPTIVCAAFSDVSQSNPYATAINALQAQQILGGYPDGTFRPSQTINRAELLKILVHANGENPSAAQYHDCFPDVHAEWFSGSVCYAHSMGWVQGYGDGTFHPESVLTEAEALKMVIVSLQSAQNTDGCDHTFWYSVYVCEANRLGVLGSTSFAAAAPMTRGMAAEWMYNALSGGGQAEASSSVNQSSAGSSPDVSGTSDSSSSPSAQDDNAWLKRLQSSMSQMLQKMQGADTMTLYTVFGADNSDVQRLEEIPNEYAKIVNSITLYMNQTLQSPLTASDRQQIASLSSQADALSSEFKTILDRLQCAMEKDCSLKN